MTASNSSAPLVVTPGEPAGIGPELILQLAEKGFDCPIVVMASMDLLAQRAREIGLDVALLPWNGHTFDSSLAGHLVVQDCPLTADCALEEIVGVLNADNSVYVLNCLDQAIDGCLDGRFSGLVTGPIHKGIINEAQNLTPSMKGLVENSGLTRGDVFSGHTEYLQQRCHVSKVVMMLASPRMRVALASTHLPLRDVADSITKEMLTEILHILIHDLQNKFAIPKPRILVAGLNPHAGEGGHMGREEIEIIQPVLDSFKLDGIQVDGLNKPQVELIGPLPADTLFNPKYLEKADAVLAMYHDQGLPVLKFDGFSESVNITLGLPIIRTSVDHGTALDLAGSGKADSGSFRCAIQLAKQMAVSSSNSSTPFNESEYHGKA